MKKKFEIPKLIIVTFINDDIITGSGEFGNNDNDWYDPEDSDPIEP